MIALVEGAERRKTPNEIALTILLVGLTIVFLIAVATIPGFTAYAGGAVPVALLAALLITLIPTTIAALMSAIGIARSEEHTSELQSLMRISYAVFCLKKKKHTNTKL